MPAEAAEPRGNPCTWTGERSGWARAVRNWRGEDGAVAGAPDGLAPRGLEVEPRADAQDRRDHGGIALARRSGAGSRKSLNRPSSLGSSSHVDNMILAQIDMYTSCKYHGQSLSQCVRKPVSFTIPLRCGTMDTL